MTAPAAADGARLVVALEGDEETLAILETAVRIAARLERELVGLFLEDTDLLAAARLSATRFVAVGGVEPLDPTAVRRMARAQAERARRRISQLAERHRIRWRFEISTSSLAAAALLATDVLATGRRPRSWARTHPAASPPPCPTILIGRPPGAVLLLYEGGAGSLELARRIALDDASPLVVLALASGLATAAERVDEARRRLASEPAPGSVVVLAVEVGPPAALAASIRTWRPAVIVADTCSSDDRLRAAVQALRI